MSPASSRPSVDYPEAPLSGELSVDFPSGCRWGVCLSHDVDHLGLREHLIDSFLVRYVANLLRQNISFSRRRFRVVRLIDQLIGIVAAGVGRDRWDVTGELIEAERRAGLKSTWFVAVRKGLGINYSRPALSRLVQKLRSAGLEVGLHGQSTNDSAALADEVGDLSELIDGSVLGMRMHYLRLSRDVLDGMSIAGLSYDSTVMDRSGLDPRSLPLPAPRMVRPSVIEIPLHVMDSTLFSVTGLGLSESEALDYLEQLALRAVDLERVIVLNLHPNTYSRQSPEIRRWYDRALGRLTARSDVFLTDFRNLLPRIQRP